MYSVSQNLYLPYWLRQYAVLTVILLPLHTSASYLKLRCFFSNQSRSILTHFKMNRFRFKQAISQNQLTGISKSS